MMKNSFTLTATSFVVWLGISTLSSLCQAEENFHGKAFVNATDKGTAAGTVTFAFAQGETKVVADIRGLTPGEHGIHIHEFGDCSAPDGASAGGHFNPTGKPHGAPTSSEHHAGDFGNLVADKNGVAHLSVTVKGSLLSGAGSAPGRAIIIHSKADDFQTQPSGNSGDRIGCGVIGISKD